MDSNLRYFSSNNNDFDSSLRQRRVPPSSSMQQHQYQQFPQHQHQHQHQHQPLASGSGRESKDMRNENYVPSLFFTPNNAKDFSQIDLANSENELLERNHALSASNQKTLPKVSLLDDNDVFRPRASSGKKLFSEANNDRTALNSQDGINLSQSFQQNDLADSAISEPSSKYIDTLKPLSKVEGLWPHWIVVFGFRPDNVESSGLLQYLLRKFQEYGDIDDYSLSSGNWLFIRYVSPIQAERATSMNGAFISSRIMIGVRQLNTRLAKELNVNILVDGRLDHSINPQNENMSREGTYGFSYRRNFDTDYEQIMRPPKRTKSVCTRIMEFFMIY